jgi:uncharacterized protein (DUF1330 family)
MPKALWVSTYRSITDADAMAAYGKLAGPALQDAGGRFLARSVPTVVFEAGLEQRVVVIEFDSVDAAVAAHDSEPYQAALRALGKGAVRDIRIVDAL